MQNNRDDKTNTEPTSENPLSFLEQLKLNRKKILQPELVLQEKIAKEEKEKEEKRLKEEKEEKALLDPINKLINEAKIETNPDLKMQKSLTALEHYSNTKDKFPNSKVPSALTNEMEGFDREIITEFNNETHILRNRRGWLRQSLYPAAKLFYRLHISLYPSTPKLPAIETSTNISTAVNALTVTAASQPMYGMIAHAFPVVPTNQTVADLTQFARMSTQQSFPSVAVSSHGTAMQDKMCQFVQTLSEHYYTEFKAKGYGDKLKDALTFLEDGYRNGFFDEKTQWEPDSLLPLTLTRIRAEWNKKTMSVLSICKNTVLRDHVVNYFVKDNNVPDKGIIEFLEWYFKTLTYDDDSKINGLIDRLAVGIFKRTIQFNYTHLSFPIIKRLESVLAQKYFKPFDCDKALDFIYSFYKAPHQHFDRSNGCSLALVDKIAAELKEKESTLDLKKLETFIYWYMQSRNVVYTPDVTFLFYKLTAAASDEKITLIYPSSAIFKGIEDEIAKGLSKNFNYELAIRMLYRHFTHPFFDGTIIGSVKNLIKAIATHLLETNSADVSSSLSDLLRFYPDKSHPGCIQLHKMLIQELSQGKKLPPIAANLLRPNFSADSLIECSDAFFDKNADDHKKEITFKRKKYKFEKRLGNGAFGYVAKFTATDKSSISIKTFFNCDNPQIARDAENSAKIWEKVYGIGAIGVSSNNPNHFVLIMPTLPLGKNEIGMPLNEYYKEMSRIPSSRRPDHFMLTIPYFAYASLQKLHEMGIVHEDAKPENAMAVLDATTKQLKRVDWMDFELSRWIGTLTYPHNGDTRTISMAPELSRSIPADPIQDIPRLPVVLFSPWSDAKYGYSPINGVSDVLKNFIQLYVQAAKKDNPSQRPSLPKILIGFRDAIRISKDLAHNAYLQGCELCVVTACMYPDPVIQTGFMLELLEKITMEAFTYDGIKHFVDKTEKLIHRNLSQADFYDCLDFINLTPNIVKVLIKEYYWGSPIDEKNEERFIKVIDKFGLNPELKNSSKTKLLAPKSKFGRAIETEFDDYMYEYYQSPFDIQLNAKDTTHQKLFNIIEFCRSRLRELNTDGVVTTPRNNLYRQKVALHILNLMFEYSNRCKDDESYSVEQLQNELETIGDVIYKFISKKDTTVGEFKDLSTVVSRILPNPKGNISSLQTKVKVKDSKFDISKELVDSHIATNYITRLTGRLPIAEIVAAASKKDASTSKKVGMIPASKKFFFNKEVKNLFQILSPQAKDFLFSHIARRVNEQFDLHFALTFLSYYLNNVTQRIKCPEIKKLVQTVGDRILSHPLKIEKIKSHYPDEQTYKDLHKKLIRAYYNQDRYGICEFPLMFRRPKQRTEHDNKLVVAPLVQGRAFTV